MNAGETATKSFREAAQQFDGTSKLFLQLTAYKDEIAELRRKGASYDAISELLKIDGVNVSWKTVARFCHATFDAPRSRRRRALPAKIPILKPCAENSELSVRATLKEANGNVATWTPRKRGPRIADSKNL